jgi:hypothetical protein
MLMTTPDAPKYYPECYIGVVSGCKSQAMSGCPTPNSNRGHVSRRYLAELRTTCTKVLHFVSLTTMAGHQVTPITDSRPKPKPYPV